MTDRDRATLPDLERLPDADSTSNVELLLALPDSLLRSAIEPLLARAAPDELRVLLLLASRFVGVGQRCYDRLELDTDQRDHVLEMLLEQIDGMVYGTAATVILHRRRARSAPR